MAYKLYISKDIKGFSLADALEQISPERREKALKFRFEQGQRECVLAYLLLKRALKETYGIDGNPRLTEQKDGKPVLTDYPHIHFNLSHCKEAVACVVGDEAVGVDVERIGRYTESLAHYVLSEEEVNRVEASENPGREFIKLWTMKEALLKLTGEGIRDDLKKALLREDVKFDVQEHENFICTVCTWQ